MKGNFLWISCISSRVFHAFWWGSPRIKSTFIEIGFLFLSFCSGAEESLFHLLKRFSLSCSQRWFWKVSLRDDKRAAPTLSSARKILLWSLRWIALSVVLSRLCIPIERRLTPRVKSPATYSLVMSSGLHSNDISALFLLPKRSRISSTSTSERIEGVPHQKYMVEIVSEGRSWKYVLISFLRCAIYILFFVSSKTGVNANLQYGHFCRQKGMWR